MPDYDYIIIGAGASGLLLADAIGKDAFFTDEKVLLLDKSNKTQNDRTWCFWEKDVGEFDSVSSKTWPNIQFAGQEMDKSINIAPYSYKMLRGLDFYNEYLKRITAYKNIDFIQDEIEGTKEYDNSIQVFGKKNSYTANQVFDSRFDYQKLISQSKYPVLQQHFLGWFIKTEKPVFDIETATFMDFSIPQKGNTRFMYVLPFSENEALLEYTLFSETVLEKTEYEDAIKDYLENKLEVKKYEILEVEQGNIPMSCFDYTAENTDHFLKIGIAGGWAKASTGYTFYPSSKKVNSLIAHLKAKKPLSKFSKKSRFWYYDLLLLDILYNSNQMGQPIFESLFKKRKPQLIFKFLNEETNLLEEAYIMGAPKPWPFIKSLFRRIF